MENTIRDNAPSIKYGDEESYNKEKDHFDFVLTLVLDLCGGLLGCGASVNRVEFACKKICMSLGAKEVNVFAFPSIIQVSVKLMGGGEVSQMKRVYFSFNNFHKLEVLNQLSRDICCGKYDLATARKMLDDILANKYYRLPVAVLGGGVAAGAFAVFFGGTLIDSIPAIIIGLLMTYLNFLLLDRDFNSYARTFVLSVIGAFLSLSFSWLLQIMGLKCNSSMIIIGTIMVVIPGLLICNSFRDMLAGDLFSGTFELLNGVITTFAIAAGYGLMLFLMRDIVTVTEVVSRTGVAYYAYIIPACLIGSAGFSVMFNVNYRKMPIILLNIMITFTVYLLMERFVGNMFADTLVATLVASIIAEVMARLFKAPSNIFMVPAIMAFVPGGALYYAVSYTVSGDSQLAAYWGTTALSIFLGIAVGLSVITAAYQIIHPMNRYLRLMNDKFKNKH